MASHLSARRPLKTRDMAWARWVARSLAERRVSPNSLSVLSVIFAAGGAASMLVAPTLDGGGRSSALVLAAVCVQMRLLCNMLDGMVAVEGGLGAKTGDVYNELPDRIADPLLIVPAGYAAGFAWGPELAWLAAVLALLTAYVRALGGLNGLPQGFQGPMAKPHRMAAMTLGLLLAAVAVPFGLDGSALLLTLAVVASGTFWTLVRRTRSILSALESQ